MVRIFFIFAGVLVLSAIGFILARFCLTWMRVRGARLINCPETNAPAGVEVDAVHAALPGSPKLRLKECSRWPERQNCGQECVSQIAAAPEDCLVRNILARWYAYKECARCGKAFGNIDWLERKPALWRPGEKTLEWDDLAAEEIPQALATHLPVCRDCHIAARFRLEHPELVTDRTATNVRNEAIH